MLNIKDALKQFIISIYCYNYDMCVLRTAKCVIQEPLNNSDRALSKNKVPSTTIDTTSGQKIVIYLNSTMLGTDLGLVTPDSVISSNCELLGELITQTCEKKEALEHVFRKSSRENTF